MRRRISQIIDSLDGDILRFAQNDIEEHFFSNLLSKLVATRVSVIVLCCDTLHEADLTSQLERHDLPGLHQKLQQPIG